MKSDDKFISFVSKLNRFTQEGKINWKREKPPTSLTSGTDYVVKDFYTTEYKDRIIGIFELHYQGFEPVFNKIYWDSTTKLAIFNENRDIDYQFDRVAGLSELMKSVKHKSSNIDDFIDDVIADD